MTSASILVADHQPQDRRRLRLALLEEGFAVAEAANAQCLLAHLQSGLAHLIVLDIQLPGMTDLALCRRIKRYGDVPIVVLTAMDDDDRRVAALSSYADDYIVKPPKYPELIARIRSVLRRSWLNCLSPEFGFRVDEHLSLDFARREARTGQRVTHLTPLESRLLQLMVANAGQVLPSSLLLQRLWGDGEGSIGSLWEHIRRLRRKLGDDSSHPRYIVNEPGLGYRFARPASRPLERHPNQTVGTIDASP